MRRAVGEVRAAEERIGDDRRRRFRRARRHGQRPGRQPRGDGPHRHHARHRRSRSQPRRRDASSTTSPSWRRRADIVVLSLPDGAVSRGRRRRDHRHDRSDRPPRGRHLDRRSRGVAELIDGCSPTPGSTYVDAPVSGGAAGARARTLTVMYAGSPRSVCRCRTGARRSERSAVPRRRRARAWPRR